MSRKNRNKKKNIIIRPTPSITAEKLNEQLNRSDESPAEQPRTVDILAQDEQKSAEDEKTDSSDLLAQYEQKALEAEKRMAERRRKAEEEAQKQEIAAKKAEKNAERRKLLEEQFLAEQREAAEAKPEPDLSAELDTPVILDERDADVKQFIPRTPKPVEEKEEVSGSINEALSESYEELSEPSAENAGEEDASAEKEQEKPNRFYLVFALFVIIMSVIGVISVTKFFIGVISDIADQKELKNEIALFLYPVVTVDPPDCDTVDELPSTIIVESAIWRIILTGDTTNYEKLYNTYMYVPAIDVEFSVRSIFGNGVKIEHQTVGTMDMTFTYNAENNSYLVPINPHYTAYSPRITELSSVGELYTVTVEYLPPSALAVEGIDFEVTPAKTIIYTMSKSRNSATIHSIKNITRFGTSYEY